MPITRDQIIQNIHSLEQQGASQQDIQGYIDSMGGKGGGSPQAGTSVPGMERLGGQAPPIAAPPNSIIHPRPGVEQFQQNHPVADVMLREAMAPANAVPFPGGMAMQGVSTVMDPAAAAVARGAGRVANAGFDKLSQIGIGGRGAIKGGAEAAVKSATDPVALAAEGAAEFLGEKLGLPKGVGAGTAATPRVIGGAVRGAKNELQTGLDEIPTAAEAPIEPFKPFKPPRDPNPHRGGVGGGGDYSRGGRSRTAGVTGRGPNIQPLEDEASEEGYDAGVRTAPSPVTVPGSRDDGGVTASTASSMGRHVRDLYSKNPRIQKNMEKLTEQADAKDTHIGQTLVDNGFTHEHVADPTVLSDDKLNELSTALGHGRYTGQSLSRTPAEGRASLVEKMKTLQPVTPSPVEDPEQ